MPVSSGICQSRTKVVSIMMSISDALKSRKRPQKSVSAWNYSLLLECLLGFVKGVAGTLAAFGVILAVLYFFM